MKPAAFEYYAPTSLDEALEILARLGYDGKVLAGGQSLVPAMNFRMALPAALVDLNTMPELSFINPTGDGGLLIGTMTRDSIVEHNPLVKERAPMIAETMFHVAHPQIRNRGTFGGLMAHADPTAQIPAVVFVLNARFHVRGKDTDRWDSSEEFFLGPFATSIEPGEMLVEIEIPAMAPRTGSSYKQMARQAGAQALVGAASVITLDEAGKAADVRIALTSVGEIPVFAAQAVAGLVGETLTPELIEAAAESASTVDIDPGADIHCSVEYRRHLARVLTRQSLTEALERAGRNGGKK
jgi:carbon-monoxide dehydrogenase medium subunit